MTTTTQCGAEAGSALTRLTSPCGPVQPLWETLSSSPTYVKLATAAAASLLLATGTRRLLNTSSGFYLSRWLLALSSQGYSAASRRLFGQQPWKEFSECEIPKEFLREIIAKALHLSSVPPLRSAKVQGNPLRGGHMGLVYKIELEWEQTEASSSQAQETLLPRTLVVKTNPPGFRSLLASFFLESTREALFYKNYQEAFGKGFAASGFSDCIPKVFFASGDSWTGAYCIIMEDLSQDTVPGGHMFGNQCWGAVTLPSDVPHDPIQVLETIFLRVAKLHGAYWRDRSLLSHEWLKETKWLQGGDRGKWEYSITATRRNWDAVLTRIAEGKTKVVWSTNLINAMSRALANTSWESYQKEWHISQNPPFTLVHGDFHASNMLWRRGGSLKAGPFFMLDWPAVGIFCPFTELAQLVISHVPIELRRTHEKRLLRVYYDALVESARVPIGLTFEDCWERYKAGGIERWLQMLSIMASLRIPDECLQWFHEQVASFVEDHADSCRLPILLKSAYSLP